MKRTILALILLLAGTAPASAAFLGANSPLGESFLNTGIEKVAGDVSLEVPMGCGRAWLERTAECFVAPGAMAGSGLSGGSSAAATYPAKFMEGAADVGEGTPLAESAEIEIPVTFEGFAAPGPEAQAFVNQEIVGPGPESQPFVNQEIVGPGPEAQPFVNQEFAGAGGESPESAAAEAGQAPGNTFPENEGQIQHIFRDAEGHLPDTATNRSLLQGVADDPATTLGNDAYGNTWSARTNADGTQTWVQTRNGVIINGGVNQTPNTFNPQTGLSSPVKPGGK